MPAPSPQTPTPPASRRKLHRRFAPVVFAFYMACTMAFMMCCAIIGIHTGFSDGYLQRVLQAYAFAMPVAFCCVMLVRPLIGRLVAATVES